MVFSMASKIYEIKLNKQASQNVRRCYLVYGRCGTFEFPRYRYAQHFEVSRVYNYVNVSRYGISYATFFKLPPLYT